MEGHSREEILVGLGESAVATVVTAVGSKVRTRMMHFAHESDFTIYLSSMKGDPKTLELVRHPALSLLIFRLASDRQRAQAGVRRSVS